MLVPCVIDRQLSKQKSVSESFRCLHRYNPANLAPQLRKSTSSAVLLNLTSSAETTYTYSYQAAANSADEISMAAAFADLTRFDDFTSRSVCRIQKYFHSFKWNSEDVELIVTLKVR